MRVIGSGAGRNYPAAGGPSSPSLSRIYRLHQYREQRAASLASHWLFTFVVVATILGLSDHAELGKQQISRFATSDTQQHFQRQCGRRQPFLVNFCQIKKPTDSSLTHTHLFVRKIYYATSENPLCDKRHKRHCCL